MPVAIAQVAMTTIKIDKMQRKMNRLPNFAEFPKLCMPFLSSLCHSVSLYVKSCTAFFCEKWPETSGFSPQ